MNCRPGGPLHPFLNDVLSVSPTLRSLPQYFRLGWGLVSTIGPSNNSFSFPPPFSLPLSLSAPFLSISHSCFFLLLPFSLSLNPSMFLSLSPPIFLSPIIFPSFPPDFTTNLCAKPITCLSARLYLRGIVLQNQDRIRSLGEDRPI